jgi:hypothetical protein
MIWLPKYCLLCRDLLLKLETELIHHIPIAIPSEIKKVMGKTTVTAAIASEQSIALQIWYIN